MKVDKFINSYYSFPQESGYGPGEVPKFSEERVKKMLKDLLNLVTDNAKIRIVTLGEESLATVSSEAYFKESGSKVTVDKISILNILES